MRQATQSLAVVTVYHAAIDEIRDALETTIGYGSANSNLADAYVHED